MSNEELYELASETITKLFSDLTVDKATTRSNLCGLIEEIDVMLNSMEEENEEA